MADDPKNDQAFIAISSELRKLENSHAVMCSMLKAVQRMDQWARTYFGEIGGKKVYTDEITDWIKVFPFISDDGTLLKAKLAKTMDRIEELRKLQDVYLKGGNILQSKLSTTKD